MRHFAIAFTLMDGDISLGFIRAESEYTALVSYFEIDEIFQSLEELKDSLHGSKYYDLVIEEVPPY